MEKLELGAWLLQQAPVIIVMGIAIYWLVKAFQEERKRNRNLSDKVVELCTLWEHKAGQLNDIEKNEKRQILELLIEIKELVKK